MEESKKAKRTLIIINIFVIIFIVLLITILSIHFWDDIIALTTKEGQLAFSEAIRNTGFMGVFIIIIVNIFQVVVAFIPGEFIEIVCGMLFGPILGAIVCMIGFALGTVAIFGLVKLLGKPFMDLNVDAKKRKRLKFLENETRALIVLFFVFLIPGTPKDFITYAIPFTKIKMIPFIIVSTIARIPSIISSTIIGDAITSGENKIAIIVSIVTFIIAVIGIILNKPITNKVEQIVNRKQNKNNEV